MTTPKSPVRRLSRAGRSVSHGTAGAACALALAAALTGCGAGGSTSAAPSHSAASPKPAKSSAPPSPSPSPSKTPVKPLKPSTRAELQACADGTCTIVVTQGTVIPAVERLGVGSFTVTDVGAGGVDLTSISSTGFRTSLLGQMPGQGGPSSVNGLSIAVLVLAGDTAKLRLYPTQ